MKRAIYITALSISWLGVFAQKVVAGKVDTSQITLFHQLISGSSQYPGLWVIDDKPINDSLVKQVLKNINPKDILEVSVLKQSSTNSLTSSATPSSPTVLVVTRQYAVSQYQKKLSAFSGDYKKYVTVQMKLNHNDDGIFYIISINGDGKYFSRDDMIRELYDVPKAQITKVDFSRQQTCCGINAWVGILIKQGSLKE